MGCDGGSIPRREELVKTKKKEEKPQFDIQLKTSFSTCFLSKLVLQEPIVSCLLGRLYNKQNLLQHLLAPPTPPSPSPTRHIKSLKDTILLKLTRNPLTTDSKQSSNILSQYNDTVEPSLFICPITLKEMNGYSKFVYLSCGCVMSETALKTVDSDTCLVCGLVTTKNHFNNVVINPMGDDLVAAKKRVDEREAERKLEKLKAKKRKRSEKEMELPSVLKDDKSDEKLKSKKRIKKHEKIIALDDARMPSINMIMPNLDSINAPKSKVVKEMYHENGKGENEGNYLTKGTFNRYAAGKS